MIAFLIGAIVSIVPAPDAFSNACKRLDWLCVSSAQVADVKETLPLLHKVNSRVNSSISPKSDQDNYGVVEYWTLPINGFGDCEDYALAKYRDLLDEGVGRDKLRVAVVLDRNRRNHVVLIVRHNGVDLVLDNLTNKIKPWNKTRYTYLAVQIVDDPNNWEVVVDRTRDRDTLSD